MGHLIAACTLVAMLAGAGGWLIHQLRAGDAREIEALAKVANDNADRIDAERAQAASYAANVRKATQEQADAHRRTQGALDALRAQWDEKAADDPCRLCTLDWPADRLQLPGNDG